MKIAQIEVTLIDYMGTDLSIVNAARVSFHKESEWAYKPSQEDSFALDEVLAPRDKKLIEYLAKHKHTSPFNHTFITVRVKAPIFVARQLVKHKFMPWNEVSRRYVDDEPEFFLPTYWRGRPENSKQGSMGEAPNQNVYLKILLEHSLSLYNDMLGNGVAPEQARMVLPQNTMTEWIWSGTLGAYADMLKLRLDPHAQYESRLVAQKIKDIIEPLFPVSLPALLGTNDEQTGIN